MAIKIECDGGCGVTGTREAEFVVIGHFAKKTYCEKCAQSISDFHTQRDALHDDAAKQWDDKYDALKAKWRKAHKGGSLPDE